MKIECLTVEIKTFLKTYSSLEEIHHLIRQSEEKINKLKHLLLRANSHISELKTTATQKDEQISNLDRSLEEARSDLENLKRDELTRTGRSTLIDGFRRFETSLMNHSQRELKKWSKTFRKRSRKPIIKNRNM